MDGCPRFAKAYSGFPVELAGVGGLHAAFLKESRTRGCWWRPVRENEIFRTLSVGGLNSTEWIQLDRQFKAIVGSPFGPRTVLTQVLSPLSNRFL